MTGAEANPAAGIGLLAVLIYTGYWVVRSRRRWRTILYALLALAATFFVGILFAYLFQWMAGAVGTLTAFVSFIAMAITAAEHARSTIRRSKELELSANPINTDVEQ